MPRYKVNGKYYNIPDDKVGIFEQKYPNAQISYVNGSDIYDIDLSDREDFMKQFPGAKFYVKEAPKPVQDQTVEARQEEQAAQAPGVKPTIDTIKAQPMTEPEPVQTQQDSVKQPLVPQQPIVQAPVEVADTTNRTDTLEAMAQRAAQEEEQATLPQRANREQVAALSSSIDDALNAAITKSMEGYDREQEEAKKLPFGQRLMRFIGENSAHHGDAGATAMRETKKQFGGAGNAELQSRISSLQAAKKAITNAEHIINEADHAINSGDFSAFSSTFAGGAARGFGQKLFDVSTWDMGMSDMENATAIGDALAAYESGTLTDAQQALLDAKAVELATNAYFGSYVGRGYKAGGVTAESIPFMLEMCINPASTIGEAATNRMARYAISRFGKEAAKKATHKVLRAAGRAGADLVGAAAMTGTTGIIGVAADAAERMNGDIDFVTNPDGQSIFAGVTPGTREDAATAVAKAFAGRTIENYSEMVGEYFAPVLGAAGKVVGNTIDNLHLSGVRKFIDGVAHNDVARLINDFEKNAHWNGMLGEYAEEVIGGIMNALVVGDQTLDAAAGTGVFNLDNNIDTFLGVSLMGGFLSGAKTFGYRTPKYRARQQVAAAINNADVAFEGADNWQNLRDMADQDPNAALHEVLTGDYTPEQRRAMLEYTKVAQEYQGTLEAEEKRRTAPETDPLQTDMETSFDNGYTLATDEEMNDASNNLEYQTQRLQDMLGVADIDEQQILNQEDMPLTDEQREVAIDFLNAKATYEGMIHRVQDNINERIAAANAEVDLNVNPQSGLMHPADMLDGRHVYITGGNVVVAEDGTIDKPNSTNDIIIRDPQTGKKEFTSLDFIKSADPSLDPQAEKDAAANTVREQMAREYADRIDGRLQFNLNDVYQLTPPEGEPFTVQVVANEEGLIDNGDGTVNVLVGNDPRVQLMQKDVVQQLMDNTRLARLGMFQQQKQAQRQQEVQAVAEEARPTYNLDDEVTLDVDGTPVRGSIVSEPNADGQYEVYTELPVNGRKVNLFTRDQLDAMLRVQNGQEVQAPAVQQAGEIAQQEAPIEQNQPQIAQESAQTAQQPEGPAIDRIPKDEAGEPIFEQAEVRDTYQALLDMNEGDETETVDTAAQMVANVQKELEKAEKAKAKGTTPMQIQQNKAQNRAAVAALRKKLDYWNKVAAYPEAMRRNAEEEQRRQRRARLAEARKIQERNGRFAKEDAQLGEPLSFRDFIMRNIANGFTKFKWSDDPNTSTKGLGAHLGFAGKPQEAIRRGWLLNNETGLYPEAAAEELLNQYAATMGLDEIPGMTSMDAMNELLEVLNSYDSSRIMFDAAKKAHEEAAGITEHVPAVEDVIEEETEPQVEQESAVEQPQQEEPAPAEPAKEAPAATPMSEEQREAIREMLEAADGNMALVDVMSAEDADALQQAYYDFMDTQRINEGAIDSYRNELASTSNKTRRKIAQEGIDKANRAIAEALVPLTDMHESLVQKYGLGEEEETAEQLNETQAAIQQARKEVDTNPTEAQKKAGNYKKGHIVNLDGYNITLENPKGSIRSGTDANGKKWSVTMNYDYGYLLRTEGVDGDHIDIFLSDNPEEGNVFVVDQVNPSTGKFDEHKVMYGFPDAESAREAYLSNYEEGWQGLGNITEVTKDEFKKWIDSSHRKTKPFAEYKSVKPVVNYDTPLNGLSEVKDFMAEIGYNGGLSKVFDSAGRKFVKYVAAGGGIQPNIYFGETTKKDVLRQFYMYGNVMDVDIPDNVRRELEKEAASAKQVSDQLYASDREEIKSILNNAGIPFVDVIDSERGSRIVYTNRKTDNGNYMDYTDYADPEQVKENIDFIRATAERYNKTEPEVKEVNVEGLMGAVSDMFAGKRGPVKLSEFAEPVQPEEGQFGKIFRQFVGKTKEAIDFLLKQKTGEAIGALSHKDIGEISLVYGNDKAGLKKIAEKHPEVLEDLQGIIDGMEIVKQSDNRIKLESDTHFAVVSRDYEGTPRTPWLLSAFEKKGKENSAPDNTMDTGETQTGERNDTATPQNTVSDGKDTDNSGTSKLPDNISIEPATYTNKKGKVLNMFLVKPGRELSHEEMQAVSKFLKENRGWKDRTDGAFNGGFMIRTEEQANALADMFRNPQAMADAQPVSLSEMKEIGATTIDTQEVQAPAEEQKEPVYKYELHSNPDTGYTRLERAQVLPSGIEILDDWEVRADTPRELKEVLQNNGLYDNLSDFDKESLERRIEVHEFRKEARENGVNGFHIGDKVLWVEPFKEEGREAVITSFEDYGDHHPTLDAGEAPVLYISAPWEQVRKIESPLKEQDFIDNHVIVAEIPSAKKEKSVNPSGNKLVTDERYEELKRKMKAKLTGQMNMGIDPEIIAIGTEMAAYHIEKGARKFVDYAKGMIADLGDIIRPYLKAFYNAVRDLPEAEPFMAEMTPYDEVQAIDTASLGMETTADPMTTAETIVKEREVETQAKEADKKLTKVRNSSRKSVSSQQEQALSTGDLFSGLNEEETQNEEENGTQRPGAVRSEGDSDSLRSGSAAQERTGRNGQEERQEGGRVDGGGSEAGRPTDRSSRNRLDDSVKRNTRNFRIAKGAEYPRTPIARFKANIAAIRLLKELQESGKKATKEQMAVLSQYTGWGGLGTFFNKRYSNEYRALKEVLNDEEIKAAELSINTAYYTPTEVIDTMWDVVKRLGFTGGRILEGSAGIGNILASMPKEISGRSDITAVEIDDTTGGILELLYPDAKVHISGFEKVDIPNGSIDLAITNVPFSNEINVNDEKEKDLTRKFGSRLHDFCIAKNVRKLAEGGIGIFITTRGTLDSGDSQKLRDWVINEGNADFVGAFRLNNDTFEGTGATSDIIIIRKRVNGEKLPTAVDLTHTEVTRRDSWTEKSANTKWKEVEHPVAMTYNSFYVQHPEFMAGDMLFGFDRGDTFRPGSAALYPSEKKDQSKMLARWAKTFTAIATPQRKRVEDYIMPQQTAEESKGAKEGQVVINSKGEICLSRSGRAIPIGVNANKVRGYTKKQVLADYDALKTAINDALEYQQKNETDEGLKPLLDRLNKAYDTFVGRYGHFHKNPTLSWLRNDVDYASTAAVEDYKETKDIYGNIKVTVKKTGIFSGRMIGAKRTPTPSNTKDGVLVSMNEFGRINVPFIAQALGKSEEDVKAEIIEQGIGFEDPQTGEVEVSYNYLSGNVREKLQYARDHNEDGRYDKNIKALEKVIPPDIPAHLIDFSLGSDWLPVELYKQYAKEKLGLNDNWNPKSLGGNWSVAKRGTYGQENEKNRAAGVTSDMCHTVKLGHELLLAAMNNTTVSFSIQVKDDESHSHTEYDKKATEAANTKIAEMRDDFKDWLRAKLQNEPELAAQIQKTYNETFNAIAPKEISEEFLPSHFDGQVLEMGGKPFSLYPHQAKAVVRATTEPVLFAHEVGTGKTFTLITSAMEMRRLGTAKKPMIVVQNATVGQFVKSAKELYPQAKILTINDKDRTKEGRAAFYAKIKYNDWDLIIIPQSVFNMIPDSEQRKRAYIQERIDELKFIIAQAREAGNDDTVRDLEKELEDKIYERDFGEKPKKGEKKENKRDAKKEAVRENNATVRAEKQLSRRTDEVSNFDEMEIDALLIDEAHEYKHLGFTTSMTRGVKGIDPKGSEKAAGLYLKTRAVFDKAGWKNVVFATGTPISNTAAEIWTFMKYLVPKEVREANHIFYFDDFVHNFGSIMSNLEFTTSGKFREVTRFSAYTNLPELMRVWLSVADIVLSREAVAAKTADGTVSKLDDKIPVMRNWTDDKGVEHVNEAQDYYLPQSPALRSIMAAVRRELERFEKMTGKEKKQNSYIPLTMFGIARAAAIDPRLVSGNAKDEPLSKTNAAVKEILQDLEDTKSYNGATVLFCDRFRRRVFNPATGKKNLETFNVFNDIKEKLIAAGVPAEQIMIIRSGMKDEQKQRIFDRVNSGDIRVIMGTTAGLGTGVNIQERLYSEYHMDTPDRPMDYTQRMGRLLRQGNLHKPWGKAVKVVRFGVEDSLDVTGYQRLSTKAKFINSIMEGKKRISSSMENRTLEEEDEGIFDNPVAVLSGSQYALLKSQAEKELRKLRNKKEQYELDQIYVEYKLGYNEKEIERNEERIETNRKALEVLRGFFPDGKVDEIAIEGKKVKTEEQIAEVVKEKITGPIRALVNKEREKAEESYAYSEWKDKRVFRITFNGVPVRVHIQPSVVKEYDTKVEREVVSSSVSVEYSCPEVGITESFPAYVSGGLNGVKDIIPNFIKNIASGDNLQSAIDYLTSQIERMKSDNELMLQRRGKPFADADKLAKQEEIVADLTQKMRDEMAEKEAKYAAIAKEAEGSGFNLEDLDYDDEEEDEEEGSGSGTGDDTRRYRDAYHGSIASFDHFDLSHVGEGEGYQAHGYGHYVAFNPETGRAYAWNNAFEAADRDGLIEPDIAEMLRNESFEDYDAMVARYDELLEAKKDRISRELEDTKREDPNEKAIIADLTADLNTLNQHRPLSEIFEGTRHIYTVDIPEDTGDNYIDEMKTLSKAGRRRIAAVVRNLPGSALEEARKNHGPNWLPNGLETLANVIEREQYAGLELRRRLVDALGSEKAASDVMHEAGFVGIKYDGRADGPCAVIFDDNDISIVEDKRFRIREDNPPVKTGIGYKVFVLKNGQLYPPMVANPGGAATPVGVWLDADSAPVVATTTTGRQQVKAGGKGTQGGSGTLSFRPGWHLGTIPYAPQFNRKGESGEKELFPKNFVWAEVEYADDVDYQEEAMSYGYNKAGKFQHALAGLPRLPKDGSYTYRTNPDPKTDPWIITGAMKVNRLLTPSEVDEMVKAAGREPQKRQAGAVTDAQIQHLNDIIFDEANDNPDTIADETQALGNRLGAKVRTVRDVNELTDNNPRTQRRMRRAKGWYDTENGEVVVVVPNAESVADAKATVFHEIVGHKGVREIVGDERFNRFLDRVYRNADERTAASIADLARQRGWDFHEATEEYIAQLAEEGFDSRENRTFWEKVRDLFEDMISAAKLRLGFRINDNDLRYLVWRSYQLRTRKGAAAVAEDIMMQRKMKVGEYAEKRFRDPDEILHDRSVARKHYEKTLQSGLYQFREAVQDSMLGLRTLMQSILQGEGKDKVNIEDVAAFENAYLAENAMSSMNKAEQEAYYKLVMSPLLEEIAKFGVPESEVKQYMMAKHGLERNIVMAERYGREAFDADTENTKTLAEHIADARKRDYAGLTGLTGEAKVKDAEAEAARITSEFELRHATDALWDKVNAATKASLQKLYESGLLTKDGLDAISDMYEYYVPLRGWDATTSDEVYGYLTDRKGLMNSPLKKAEGRRSVADDPIAYIASMADTAIMQGNRNRMKQRFLNFALNHPSDLVSVSDIWLSWDETADEWKPVFADLRPDDTPEVVEKKVSDFNVKMKALAEADPDNYKSGKDAVNIPFKVTGDNLREHQVLVKRGGRTYVLTINGNPRAAQALNGLTNPDTDISGFIGSLIKGGQWVNRSLSSVYTTRNVEFVASNFLRDMLYSNGMTWVKESPRYALHFHKNFAKFRPTRMMALFSKWEKGTLDDTDPTERMFKQYMLNGGETGYTTVKDLDKRKKELSEQIKRYGRSMPVKNAMDFLGDSFDILNRSVENTARFAAFVTSREAGRTLERSIYDAKEVSVNFNKKGAGDRFVNANGQTVLGKIGGYSGAAGRLLYVFWNAGVQGLTNFSRGAKRHPVKALAGMAGLFSLGMAVAALAASGGGDDDDKNAYYNLPEYVRRSNICFRVGNAWITIPMPIEYRGIYGLGELAVGVLTGKEHYSDKELAFQIGSQVSQVLPLDMLEGGGGISPFIPSAAKPVVEAYIMNKGWTGMPVYKKSDYNRNMPEWTKAYKSANKQLVELAEAANRMTGGDEFTKGAVDINPARIEYLLSGYFGGYEKLVNKLIKMGETAVGAREFEWRNMLVASSVVKSGDERTANRKLTSEYYNIREKAESVSQRLRGYENRADEGDERYEDKLEKLEGSRDYLLYEIYDEYGPDIDAIRKDMKQETDPEALKDLEAEMYDLMRQMVDAVHNAESKNK